jgi:hypothetical protein
MPSKLMARFERHRLCEERDQAIAKAVREDPTRETPLRPGSLPLDPFAVRGLPAVGGPGSLGSSMLGTRPDKDCPSMRTEPRPR